MVRKNEKLLRPIFANAGIEADYRRRMRRLVVEMSSSYTYWLRATYRSNPPRMAQDEVPSRELERLLRQMGIQWEKRFAEAAPKLARYFAQSTRRQSEAALRRILRDSGVTVRTPPMTGALRDVMQATIAENVSLIKSIASEYHTEIEGLVMRSVTAGRDLEQLTTDLRNRYGITQRRAEFIALNQNNQATAAIQRERQTSLGLTEGIWMHSAAGREPRKTHVANNGKRFSIADGWLDPDPKVNRRIWPGQLINCRCTWRPIVRGFS